MIQQEANLKRLLFIALLVVFVWQEEWKIYGTVTDIGLII
jgi:hypothetical protein